MMSQQHQMQGQQQQQQTGGSTRRSSQQRQRNMSSPDMIAVIINGWPNPQATSVASACANRGFYVVPFGLATDDAKEQFLDVPEAKAFKKPVRLVKFSDANVRQEFKHEVDEQHEKGRFLVIVDVTNIPPPQQQGQGQQQQGQASSDAIKRNVAMYNELQVPFILQSKGGETHQQAVSTTEQSNTMALITEHMNKRVSAMDQMWREWSRRYPALFDDFDFSFRTTHPSETPKSLMDSFSDLVNRELGMDSIQPFEQQQQKDWDISTSQPALEGSVTREYSFKNGGSGSSSYSFRQSVNNNEEFAESVADSVGFLAQKSQDMARPQVYSILDVAAQPTRYLANA